MKYEDSIGGNTVNHGIRPGLTPQPNRCAAC